MTPKSDELRKLYHGSSHLIKTLEPRPSRVIDNEEAVFATPSKVLAAVFAPKWSDADMSMGFYKDKMYILEQYPEAFDLLKAKNSHGIGAYLYHVDSDGFESDHRLGMRKHEFINRNKVEIIKAEIIDDVYEYLKKSGEIAMITHEQAFEAYEKAGLI